MAAGATAAPTAASDKSPASDEILELLSSFIEALTKHHHADALRLSKEILKVEPANDLVKQFQPVLDDMIKMEAEESSGEEEEEEEEEESEEYKKL